MSLSTKIPSDVWDKIFGAVALASFEDGTNRYPITTLLCVCKEWMNIVLPFIFRYILIIKESSLETLAQRLLQEDLMASTNPGSWTWTLKINCPNSHIGYIAPILLHMPNLYSYELVGPWIQTTDLSLLKYAGTRQLTSLINDATRNEENINSLPISLRSALSILSGFTSLRVLHIDTRYINEWNPVESVIHKEVLDFPSLVELDLGVYEADDFRSLGWFRFVVLKHLTLRITASSPTDFEADLYGIQGFLSEHLHIERVSFALPHEMVETLFKGEWIRASHVELLELDEYGVPDIVNLSRPPPFTTITLRTNLEPPESFWNFLQVLLSARPPNMKSLHIAFSDQNAKSSRFTWSCGSESDEHAKFSGAILSRALDFRKMGISVYDEDGEKLY